MNKLHTLKTMSDGFANTFALAPMTVDTELRRQFTQRLYTVPELMRFTGITRKQVHYWSQIGLVKPTFRDYQAKNGQPASFYSASEVIKALIICQLRSSGFSPRQVEQLALKLRDHTVELSESQEYLLTDGYSVFYASSDTEVVDILKSHRQMLLLVPVHEHLAKLKEEM